MGKNSSKIKDFIYVTGSDLDPPELNKKDRKRQQKEIKFDYRKFLPKAFYKQDVTDREIEQHLAKLEKKERILKEFKYSQDFDRIDYKQMELHTPSFQILAQQGIKMTILFSLLAARMYQIQRFNDYFTVAGMYRMFLPLFGVGMIIMLYRFAISPEYHIVNHQYFRMIPHQTAVYEQFDLKLNFYKDVQDIKYNFKYPSVTEYYKIRRDIMDRKELSFQSIPRQYYQYIHGLKLDKYEQYLKVRAEQRKKNKQAIGQNQLEQIKKDLSARHQ